MTGDINDYIHYRMARAKETYEDAEILAAKKRWNSVINRLYYAAFYAVIALLLKNNISAITHNGVKTAFGQYFIKNGIIPEEIGKTFSQLFTWRQKGDYDDLFDFTDERVMPYFAQVQQLITIVEKLIE